MPASVWDPYNWFNWYWWLPEKTDEAKNTLTENIPQVDNTSSEENNTSEESKSEELPSTEVITSAKKTKNKTKPKTTRKKRTTTKKISKSQDVIELILRPTILEELEKEAIITDSTINQVIQVILEAHIESKGASNIQTEVWKCNFCSPDREFRDYFEFSEHFFNEHMQPGLQKISEFQKQEQ